MLSRVLELQSPFYISWMKQLAGSLNTSERMNIKFLTLYLVKGALNKWQLLLLLNLRKVMLSFFHYRKNTGMSLLDFHKTYL